MSLQLAHKNSSHFEPNSAIGLRK